MITLRLTDTSYSQIFFPISLTLMLTYIFFHLGLNLSHSLSPHGSLSSRSVSNISGVNYSSLDMPIIGTMPPLTTQSSHKSMTLQPGQFVFEPQVNGLLLHFEL